MKTLLKLAVFITTCTTSAFALSPPPLEPQAPEIPLGAKMVVWAINQACEGTLEITGKGLERDSPKQIFVLKNENTLSGMLSHFNVDSIPLNFLNPNQYITTKAEILDSEGQPLFVANNGWTLERRVDKESGEIYFEIPEWSKSLGFQLQDLEVPFDGERATAVLNDGSVMYLRVSGGKLLLPASLAWYQGFVEVSKDGFVFQYDIQSGAMLSSDREIDVQTEVVGIGNIQQVKTRRMKTELYAYPYSQQVYETVPGNKGFLTVRVIPDGWVTYSSKSTSNTKKSDYDWDSSTASDGDYDYREDARGDGHYDYQEDYVVKILPFVSDPPMPDYYWHQTPVGIRYGTDGTTWEYLKGNNTGIFSIPVSAGKSVYFYFEWESLPGKGKF